MSQNLTQPEEIDQVLLEMDGAEADTPYPDGGQLNGDAHNFECDWSIEDMAHGSGI